jgi:hypothetical protein
MVAVERAWRRVAVARNVRRSSSCSASGRWRRVCTSSPSLPARCRLRPSRRRLERRSRRSSWSAASASVIFRDVVCVLLAALKEVPPKQAQDRWFAALTRYVASRPQEFPDCYPGTPGDGDSLLDRFDGDGMSFVFHVSWKCRLGLLQSLCDIAVEEAECVRDVIKEAERLSSATRQEVEARHFRLVPLGRCSQKRFYFCVGGSRIYSGFKRKGAGGVVVECSDVSSMRRLVDVLESSDNVKDAALGTKIRSWYLGPLIEGEERKRRKVDRGLAVEAQREESRRRNADRPRRARASYM